jgi:hypothetical protein
MLIGRIVLLIFTSFLVACASDEPTPAKKPVMPMTAPSASRPGNWMDVALAGVGYVLTSSNNISSRRYPQIEGVCKVTSAKVAKACADTYILIGDGDKESKVWVDSGGRFAYGIHPGHSYSVQAVMGESGLRSNILTLDRPSLVTLTITPPEH